MEINDVIAARNALVARQQEIASSAVSAGRGLTAEEQTEVQNIQRDVSGFDATINLHNSTRHQALIEAEQNDRGDQPFDPAASLSGLAAEQRSAEEREAIQRQAFRHWLVYAETVEERQLLIPAGIDRENLPPQARAALTTSGLAAVIPAQLWSEIDRDLDVATGVGRTRARVITTDTGSDLDVGFYAYHALDVVTDEESPGNALDEDDAIPFGTFAPTKKTLKARIFAGGAKITLSALQDVGLIEQEIRDQLTVDLEEKQAKRFATGNGTSQIEGITVGTTVGAEAVDDALVTAQDLMKLYYSVREKYRNVGEWVVSESLILAARLATDDNGQSLWYGSLKDGEPDRLLGRPFYTDPYMPTPAAGTRPAVFGDFRRGYTIRKVRNPLLIRLNEVFIPTESSIGWVVYDRKDGKVTNENAIKALEMAAA
jgi:HK97 family phage major capsid protein